MICSIKPQQITYVVPGIEDFDHTDISEFVQKAQGLLVSVWEFNIWIIELGAIYSQVVICFPQDPSILECAWIELSENKRTVTAEELAEVLIWQNQLSMLEHCSSFIFFRLYMAARNILKATVPFSCCLEMTYILVWLIARDIVLYMNDDQVLRVNMRIL